MSKIIFYELFTTYQAQNGPRIKDAQNLSKFGTSNISSMLIVILMSKIIFMKYLPPARPQMVLKLKCSEFIEIWHIYYFKYADLYFKYANLYFNVKNNFQEIFTTCQTKIGPKIKIAQILLKLGAFDISNIPILILMSKLVFIKQLLPIKPKLVPRLKILRIYLNLAHLIF